MLPRDAIHNDVCIICSHLLKLNMVQNDTCWEIHQVKWLRECVMVQMFLEGNFDGTNKGFINGTQKDDLKTTPTLSIIMATK